MVFIVCDVLGAETDISIHSLRIVFIFNVMTTNVFSFFSRYFDLFQLPAVDETKIQLIISICLMSERKWFIQSLLMGAIFFVQFVLFFWARIRNRKDCKKRSREMIWWINYGSISKFLCSKNETKFPKLKHSMFVRLPSLIHIRYKCFSVFWWHNIFVWNSFSRDILFLNFSFFFWFFVCYHLELVPLRSNFFQTTDLIVALDR